MKRSATLQKSMTLAATLAALGVSIGVPVERALAAAPGVRADAIQDKARVGAKQDKARVGAKQDKARIGAKQLKYEKPAGAGASCRRCRSSPVVAGVVPGSDMNLHVLARGLRFPEGPIALSDGSVLLVEVARGTLSRVRPDGAVEVVAELGGGPNGAALGPDGAVYVCNNGGFRWHESKHGLRPLGQADDYSGGRIERVDLASGEARVLYDAGPNGPLKGPNDIVFDRAGGMWFTDLGKARARDMDRGGVYYARADGGSISEAIYPLLTPNGIGLSPDESRLYVAETHTGRLWAFDLEAPGAVKRRRYPSPNGGELVAGCPGSSCSTRSRSTPRATSASRPCSTAASR